MTAPGTYVTVREGQVTIAQNNLGAYEVLEISVLGPDLTARFLDAWQRLEPSDEWDDDHAEGGLLVDFDCRVLMMFCVYRDPSIRAAYLDAVTRSWPGWQVRWAYDGIADLIEYVGGDTSQIRCEPAAPEALYWGERTEDMQLRFVVTIGEGQAYGLAWNTADPWRVGPGLLEQLAATDRITTVSSIPEAGMHLDPLSRTAGIWTSIRPLRGVADYWPRLWPGWTLELWDDRSTEQLERCAGAVAFPAIEPLGPRRLAREVMRAWSFFVADDVDGNYRDAFGSEEAAAHFRESRWHRARELTRISRWELSAGLQTITGRQWPHPRWPDFNEPEIA